MTTHKQPGKTRSKNKAVLPNLDGNAAELLRLFTFCLRLAIATDIDKERCVLMYNTPGGNLVRSPLSACLKTFKAAGWTISMETRLGESQDRLDEGSIRMLLEAIAELAQPNNGSPLLAALDRILESRHRGRSPSSNAHAHIRDRLCTASSALGSFPDGRKGLKGVGMIASLGILAGIVCVGFTARKLKEIKDPKERRKQSHPSIAFAAKFVRDHCNDPIIRAFHSVLFSTPLDGTAGEHMKKGAQSQASKKFPQMNAAFVIANLFLDAHESADTPRLRQFIEPIAEALLVSNAETWNQFMLDARNEHGKEASFFEECRATQSLTLTNSMANHLIDDELKAVLSNKGKPECSRKWDEITESCIAKLEKLLPKSGAP